MTGVCVGWLEVIEPLLRFSRINEASDGCEQAYKAIATEFHADKPDFEQFVQSEAIARPRRAPRADAL